MGILMWKIRRSRDRLIFNMGILILVRQHLYTETPLWFKFWNADSVWQCHLGICREFHWGDKTTLRPSDLQSPQWLCYSYTGKMLSLHWIISLGPFSVSWSEQAQSKLRLCSANHRPGYWSNLPCDWLNTAWAYSKQGTGNGPRSYQMKTTCDSKSFPCTST